MLGGGGGGEGKAAEGCLGCIACACCANGRGGGGKGYSMEVDLDNSADGGAPRVKDMLGAKDGP